MGPFGDLAALRERPIPDQAEAIARRRGYRTHPLDLTSPAAGEPLVEVAAFGIEGRSLYAHPRLAPYYESFPGALPRVLVREGVARRLATVNDRLWPIGAELLVLDGWRPTALQAYFHDVWVPARLTELDPTLEGEALTATVESYWAAPTVDPASPAPHATGGAVDLTIRWKDTGESLWMGSLVDEVSELAHPDHFEKTLAGSSKLALSDAEARANRRLLHWLMIEAGFTHNPTEWWHFSYGEQMWARLTGAGAAIYGQTQPTEG